MLLLSLWEGGRRGGKGEGARCPALARDGGAVCVCCGTHKNTPPPRASAAALRTYAACIISKGRGKARLQPQARPAAVAAAGLLAVKNPKPRSEDSPPFSHTRCVREEWWTRLVVVAVVLGGLVCVEQTAVGVSGGATRGRGLVPRSCKAAAPRAPPSAAAAARSLLSRDVCVDGYQQAHKPRAVAASAFAAAGRCCRCPNKGPKNLLCTQVSLSLISLCCCRRSLSHSSSRCGARALFKSRRASEARARAPRRCPFAPLVAVVRDVSRPAGLLAVSNTLLHQGWGEVGCVCGKEACKE